MALIVPLLSTGTASTIPSLLVSISVPPDTETMIHSSSLTSFRRSANVPPVLISAALLVVVDSRISVVLVVRTAVTSAPVSRPNCALSRFDGSTVMVTTRPPSKPSSSVAVNANSRSVISTTSGAMKEPRPAVSSERTIGSPLIWDQAWDVTVPSVSEAVPVTVTSSPEMT